MDSEALGGLRDDEDSIVKRGRNSVKRSPGRFGGKQSVEVYQNSTSLEALLGYLYLTEPEGERTREVLEFVKAEVVKMQEGEM